MTFPFLYERTYIHRSDGVDGHVSQTLFHSRLQFVDVRSEQVKTIVESLVLRSMLVGKMLDVSKALFHIGKLLFDAAEENEKVDRSSLKIIVSYPTGYGRCIRCDRSRSISVAAR